MKPQFFLLIISFIPVLFVGCAGGTSARPDIVAGLEVFREVEHPWIITDYKDSGSFGQVPLWASAFLEGGNQKIETLDDFNDFFVFTAANSGSNFNALKQWQDGFSPVLDFSRLAAMRIESRFLNTNEGNPDDIYGAFFETLVRRASDFNWEGVSVQNEFWVKRKFTIEDNGEDIFFEPADPFRTEAYDFLILVTVRKNVFVEQMDLLFQSINPTPSPTKEQRAAIARVQDRFFDGF